MSDGSSTAPSNARPQHAAFAFTGTEIAGRTLILRYALIGGPDADIAFEERLELPAELPAPDANDPIVKALVDGIHRAFGVSYYKAALPATIIAPPVSKDDAAFWNTLYTEGLGEFYYRNQFDPTERVQFPVSDVTDAPVAITATELEKVIVLAGGGKDSAVAREIVRSANVEADALALVAAPWIKKQVAASDLRLLAINRQLDSTLRELNAKGAWNGHVPIAACIAFVSTLAAYLGKYSAVIVANERSADEGNIEWKGMIVNHQWSKSLAFESGFQDWCDRKFSGGPRYFSILRPLGELRIAELFAQYPAYFDAFTSCNKNFKLASDAEPARWCGHCPKCVFTQLVLSPFLDTSTNQRIFGGDFLNDPANLPLVEELAGIARIKPFECVGTPDEARAALVKLLAMGRLDGTPLASWVKEKIVPLVPNIDTLWNQVRAPGGPHRLPKIWEERLYATLGTR